jgi:hypothetical protein
VAFDHRLSRRWLITDWLHILLRRLFIPLPVACCLSQQRCRVLCHSGRCCHVTAVEGRSGAPTGLPPQQRQRPSATSSLAGEGVPSIARIRHSIFLMYILGWTPLPPSNWNVPLYGIPGSTQECTVPHHVSCTSAASQFHHLSDDVSVPLCDEMKLQCLNSQKTECTLYLSHDESVWLQP